MSLFDIYFRYYKPQILGLVFLQILLIYHSKMRKQINLFFVALVFLVVGSFCEQEVPLVKGQYGFSIGNTQDYDISIQFFLDFLCPDSRDSYNEWKNVMKTIDLYNQKIKLTYQFNPLSFHFYAYKAHQAFFFVWDKAGSLGAQKFIDFVFTNQDDFQQEKWLDSTTSQFLDVFANRVAIATKVDQVGLRQELQMGTKSFYAVRSHWKYTVGMNAIAGAPQFNMNGVFVDGAADFTSNEWIKLIQTYKNSQNKEKKQNKHKSQIRTDFITKH